MEKDIFEAVIKSEEFLYHDNISSVIKKWLKGTGIAFFVLAVLLSVSIIWLVNRLKKKRDQVSQSEEDKSLFNSEIRTLWIILATFTITYIVRGAWDFRMDPLL